MNSFYSLFKKYIFTNIKDLPKNTIIIIYGSTAYGIVNNDLDVVFILETCSNELYKNIEKNIINFQKENHMQIDVEVPYSNKLVYTYDEINNILNYTLFKKSNGEYNITPVIVNNEYFSSVEMKKRLLINILTTYSKTISGKKSIINNYKKLAWENIIKIVSSYNSLKLINVDEFINLLYFDKKTNSKGEDYLGYKSNNPKLKRHLRKCILKTLKDLEKDNFVLRKDKKNYIICEGD